MPKESANGNPSQCRSLFSPGTLSPVIHFTTTYTQQLKVGKSEVKEGIKTTDLMRCYTKREIGQTLPERAWQDKRASVLTEMGLWAQYGHQILRLLDTASKGNNGAGANDSAVQGSACQEYYLRCDKRTTDLLFGPGFDGLLNARDEGVGIDKKAEFRHALLFASVNAP